MKNKAKSMLICIIGIDGVGKTTHARMISERIANNGAKCKYAWFRFHHFLSLILLAYCRFTGMTIYEEICGRKVGRHEFYRSSFVSFFYPLLLFLDMLIVYLYKIILPLKCGTTIICDRFVYDTLVDLMIDLNNPNISKKYIGKLFLKLIPRNSIFFLLDLDESVIRARRKDLLSDLTLETRRKMYIKLAVENNLKIISNEKSLNEVNEKIYENLGESLNAYGIYK